MNAEEIQCPVCGYYCLGKGGHGCIDKPTLVNMAVSKTIERCTREAIREAIRDALLARTGIPKTNREEIINDTLCKAADIAMTASMKENEQ